MKWCSQGCTVLLQSRQFLASLPHLQANNVPAPSVGIFLNTSRSLRAVFVPCALGPLAITDWARDVYPAVSIIWSASVIELSMIKTMWLEIQFINSRNINVNMLDNHIPLPCICVQGNRETGQHSEVAVQKSQKNMERVSPRPSHSPFQSLT